MKIKLFVSAILVSITVFAIGIGDEVELNQFVNGRCAAKFRAQDNNIKLVLPRGTKGRVLEVKRFHSGNLGFLLEVSDGPQAGQVVWVYYNPTSPSLKLLTARGQFTRSPEESATAQTTRQVSARRDPCSEPEAPTPTPAPPAPTPTPDSTPVPPTPVTPDPDSTPVPPTPTAPPVTPTPEPPVAPGPGVTPPPAPVTPLPEPLPGPQPVSPGQPQVPPATPVTPAPEQPDSNDGATLNNGGATVAVGDLTYTPQQAVNDILSGTLTFVGRGIPDPILDDGGRPITDGASQYCVWKNARAYVFHQGCRPTSSMPVSVMNIEVFSRNGGGVQFYLEEGSTYSLASLSTERILAANRGFVINGMSTPPITSDMNLQKAWEFYNQSGNTNTRRCAYGLYRDGPYASPNPQMICSVRNPEPTAWRDQTAAFWPAPLSNKFREAHDAVRYGRR